MFNSMVKESCFKHLQDVIATSDVTFTATLLTNIVPSTSFSFKVKTKNP